MSEHPHFASKFSDIISNAAVSSDKRQLAVSSFNLDGIAQDEGSGEEITFDRLAEMAQKLEVEVQVQEEGEEILEKLGPAPAWNVRREEVLADFVLKIETAPERPDLGITIYFEDETQAFIYDHEQAFDALVEDMTEKFSPDDGDLLGDTDFLGPRRKL